MESLFKQKTLTELQHREIHTTNQRPSTQSQKMWNQLKPRTRTKQTPKFTEENSSSTNQNTNADQPAKFIGPSTGEPTDATELP